MARTILRSPIPNLRRWSVLLSLHLFAASAAFGIAAAWAPPAHAEGSSQADAVLFVVEGTPENLDPERVRAAIARELGVPVTSAAKAPSGAGTLTLHGGAEKHIRLAYRSAEGRVTEREIDLPAEPDRAEELVALLAGNLVRDEAAELGAALKKKPEKPPTPATLPEAKPPASPPPSAPSPTAKPPASPPPSVASPSRCAHEGVQRSPVGVDLLPFLGTSSFLGVGLSRRLSLNIFGGVTAGLEGVELGGLVNIESRFACGLQVAGVANLVFGPVRGVQLADINLARSLEGAQISQIGVVIDDVLGAQIGNVNVAGGAVTGAQIGLVNFAGGKVRGAQIGLVNVASSSTFSLGLLNIFRNGWLHLDLWGQESGLVMAGIKHGSGHFHNIYGVGVLPFGDRVRFAAALGIGAHLPLSDRLFLDIDALDYGLFDTASIEATANLAQARAVLGVRLARQFAVYGGPSYDVGTSWDGKAPTLSPYGSSFTSAGGKVIVQGWPGITLGVQAL